MQNTYKSDSSIQMQAEDYIFLLVEERLGVKLDKGKKLFLSDGSYTYIRPDFFSEDARIIGEIFAHVGKPKKAQDNKIANDILKMLTYDKVKEEEFHKIIVVCDMEEYNKLKGSSALAEAINQFKIDVMYIDIGESWRQRILDAQRQQRMINE